MKEKETKKEQENMVREPAAEYYVVRPINNLSEKDAERAISGEELLKRLRPRIQNLFK